MKTTVWLAEAQSSQRDMLLSLQALKPNHDLHIIASHRNSRPEILSLADEAISEPNDDTRIDFVVQSAIAKGAKVLLTGRNGIAYEPYRAHLQAHGVRLLTGATDAKTLQCIDDKFAFTQHCQTHGIAVAKGQCFQNLDEFLALVAQYPHTRLCVKPTVGIFAQGFWILDNHHHQTDSFAHLYYTEDKKIHLEQFIDAYQHSQLMKNKPMLLMPFLVGQEYSIDVVCERGEILGAVTRHKEGSTQYLGYDTAVMAQVSKLIKAFGCDGIVSVQTKADEHGTPHVLEINPRPSGGIGYTVHSGLDLTQLAFLYFAGLSDKPTLADSRAKIRPCGVRPLMTCVKID